MREPIIYQKLMDAQSIAEKYGIQVKVGDFNSKDTLGLVQCSKNFARIIVNDSISIQDQNYVIAHQMGHLCLGHIKDDDYGVDTFATIHGRHWNKEEHDANEFADRILMPRLLVLDAIEFGLTDLKSLAHAFGVNEKIMKNRLIKLDII
jgi:Zn-dependent peptidase ImmA (M78 family)